MSIYNHIFDNHNDYKMKCPHCGKEFKYWTEDQMPGFRDKDYLFCPHCNVILATSMEVEYHVEKPTE